MRKLLPFLLIAFSLPASATTRYIAQTAGTFSGGTACNGQTAITPATFNGITNSAGDVNYICGTLTGTAGSGMLVPLGNGTSGNPVSIIFDTGATMTAPYWSGTTGAIDLDSKSYYLVDGGTTCGRIGGVEGSDVTCNGQIIATQNGNSLTYQQITKGISASPCANCEIRNIGFINLFVHPNGGAELADHTEQNAVVFSGSNVLIHNNYISNVGWALYSNFGNGDTGVQVYNNYIANMDHGLAYATESANTNATHIKVYGNHLSSMVNWDGCSGNCHHDSIHFYVCDIGGSCTGSALTGAIYNNLIDGDSGVSNTANIYYEGTVHVHVFNNVVDNSCCARNMNNGAIEPGGTGNLLANNTIIGSGTSTQTTVLVEMGGGTGMNSLNNIITTGAMFWKPSDGTFTAINNNLYANSTTNSFICNANFYDFSQFGSWQSGCSADAASQTVSNANLNTNYTPMVTSAAKGLGANLTSSCTGDDVALCSDANGVARPSTGAWDAGAIQYLSTETPLTLLVSPQGAAMQTGSTLQFTAACTYAVHAADDCTAAGGATWTTSATVTNPITVNSTGLVSAVADPGVGNAPGYFLLVSAGGLNDRAQIDLQHPGDTWYQYPTPDYHFYKDTIQGTQLPLNVVVGSTVTIGSGINVNTSGAATGTPFQGTCSWSSSDPTKATVSRQGLVTAIAVGSVDITCGGAGDAVFGSSALGGWISPGNVITLTIVNGGTGNTTWYVRPKGGTPHYTTGTPYGQCTGTTDADYPGPTSALWKSLTAYSIGDMVADSNGLTEEVTTAGTSGTAHPTWPTTGNTVTDGTVTWTAQTAYPVNQACALGNLRYLWTDLTSYEQIFWNPAFQGGDTVIVRQNTNGYPMGQDSQGTFGGPTNCTGNASSCYMPTIPSGTAAQHTRILGENYTNCAANSAKTLLYGTWSEYAMFNTKDSQYVDIACFEMTDTATCGGNSNFTNACSSTQSSGAFGIYESALSASDTYTDLYIHGLSEEAIHGATGADVVGERLYIRAMPIAGIDMDDDPWNTSNISVAGGFTLNDSTTEFTGCIELYNSGLSYPYIECRDQNAGGYADAFGTASATGDWDFDHDIWRYNYQDGLDLLHSGMNSLTVTNSQSYGNDGQQYKIGSGKTVKFQSNFFLTNCQRIGTIFGDEPTASQVQGATNSKSTVGLVITYTSGVVISGPGALTPTAVPGTSITMAASTTNYVYIDPGTFTIQSNTTGFTVPLNLQLGIATTSGTAVTNYNQINQGIALCRASGDGVGIAIDGQGTDLFQFNTMAGYSASTFDMLCTGGWQSCGAANTVFEDNALLGITNTTYNGGQAPGLFFQQEDAQWLTEDHNLYFGFRHGCPTPGGVGDVCSDVLFVNEPPNTISTETVLDDFNFNLTSPSPAKYAGVAISGITLDQNGNLRASPPSMGALEFEGATTSPVVFGGRVVFGGKVVIQ